METPITYFEDFENGNIEFIPKSGTFIVTEETNKIYQADALNSGSSQFISLIDTINIQDKDVQLTTNIRPIAWSAGEYGAGLIFGEDSGSFYTVVFEDGAVRCKYYKDGTYTTLVSDIYTYDVGTSYTLTVKISGTNASILVNNVLVTTATNISSNGKVGYIAYNGLVNFDNFKLIITPLPPPPPKIPEITAFNPISGKVGTLVTLSGKYFTGTSSVKLGQKVVSYTIVDDSTITCVIPDGAESGVFTVTTTDGQTVTLNEFKVEPLIDILYSEDFEDGKSDLLIVTGSFSITDFNGTKVFKTNATGGARAIVNKVFDNSAITVSSDVYVNSMISGTSNTVGFMSRYTDVNNYYLAIYEDDTLMINKKVKGSFTSLASKPFTLELNRLYKFETSLNGPNIKFFIDGVEHLSVQDNTFASGKIGYVVFNANVNFDNMLITSGNAISIDPPTITSITPVEGEVGTLVTITGTNFNGTTKVKFGDTEVVSYTLVSSTKITAAAPTNGGAVSVTTAVGTATGPVFTVVQTPPTPNPPTISSISPTTGLVGSDVTITGTNFVNVESVEFENVSATYSIVSSTKIVARVPVNGTGVVSVKTTNGTANGPVFTVQEETGGKIIHSFDFKDGIGIMELENDQDTSYAFKIADAPITGEKAARFEVKANGPNDGDSQRSELKIYRGDWHMDNKKDYWVGFKVLLPDSGVEEWKLGGDRWLLCFQLHNIPDSGEPWTSPPLMLCVINDKWKIISRTDPNPISGTSSAWDDMSLGYPKPSGSQYDWQGQIDKPHPDNWWEGPVDLGRWVKWVFKVRFDWTNNGSLEVWKDDVKVVNRVNMPIGTNDALGPTFKTGIYRNKPGQISSAPSQDRVLYVNRIIIGDDKCTYNQISNFVGSTSPPPPPPPVDKPTITSVTPVSGPVGTEITINGTDFTNNSQVTIGSVVANITQVSSTTIKAIVPSSLVQGMYPITVTTSTGSVIGPSFNVTSAPPPPVTAFTEPQINSSIKKGPYLILPLTNTNRGMTVLWQHTSNASFILKWGLTNQCELGSQNVAPYGSQNQYKYTITGLNPGTKYFYSLTTGSSTITNTFYTAPMDDATNIKFLAFGDIQDSGSTFNPTCTSVLNRFRDVDPSYQTVCIQMGDTVGGDGNDESDWDSVVFGEGSHTNIPKFLATTPMMAAVGNHDDMAFHRKYFPYEYTSSAGNFYAFDYGPVRFIVVDSETTYSSGSTQYKWIENELKTSTKLWKIMYWHRPPWSTGPNSSQTELQKHIHPLAVKYGIKLVYCGHNHHFSQVLKDGVTYLTIGPVGASVKDVEQNLNMITKSYEIQHFNEVEIKGNILTNTIIKHDTGKVVDVININLGNTTGTRALALSTVAAATTTTTKEYIKTELEKIKWNLNRLESLYSTL